MLACLNTYFYRLGCPMSASTHQLTMLYRSNGQTQLTVVTLSALLSGRGVGPIRIFGGQSLLAIVVGLL